MLNKNTNSLLIGIGTAWIALVVWKYLANHSYAILGIWSSFMLNILLFWIILYLLVLSYRLFKGLELKWKHKISPLSLVLGIWFFVVVAGSLLFVRMGVLTSVSYTQLLWGITSKLFLSVFFTAGIFLICASLGRFILSKFKFEFEKKLDLFLFSTGLGLAFLSLILFFLGLFGLYNKATVLATLGVIILLSLKDFWYFIKTSCIQKFEIEVNLKSSKTLFYLLFLTLIGLNSMSILRVVPIGWDGLAGYVNTSKLLASSGALFSGVNSYAYELIMGMGFLFSDNAMLSIALASHIALLGFLLVYSASSKVSRHGFLLGLLFYALPLIVFHVQQESKVDLASFFFAGLSMLAFYYWFKNKKLSFLALSAFLAGFAFSMKYTNLFLLIALLATFVFILTRYRFYSFKKSLGALVLLLSFMTLPFLPWAGFNAWDGNSFYLGNLSSGVYQGPNMSCDLSAYVENSTPETLIAPSSEASRIDPVFNFSGFREEIGRYLGYENGLGKYLLTPWTLTMNSNVQGLYVDLGFLFLTLVPLAIIFAFRKKKSNQTLIVFSIFTVIYWLLWLFLARGIIWYGMPGFLLFLVIIAKYGEDISQYKALRIRWIIVATMSILLGLNASIMSFGHPADIAYISGMFNKDQYIDHTMPSYRSIYEEINQNEGNVYRIGTFIKYFIDDNQHRVFSDDQMDNLACLLRKGSPEHVKQKLKDEGFRYIVLDLNIPSIDMTPEKSLTSKFEQTLYFIENYTKVRVYEKVSRNKILFAEL